jgi:hypothetical protein
MTPDLLMCASLVPPTLCALAVVAVGIAAVVSLRIVVK